MTINNQENIKQENNQQKMKATLIKVSMQTLKLRLSIQIWR